LGDQGKEKPNLVASGQKMDSNGGKKDMHVGALVAAHERPRRMILLKVVPLHILGNGRSVTTLGLLDSGSSVTLMTKKLAAKLGVKGKPETISINTVLVQGQDQEVCVCECTLQPVGASEPSIPVARAHIESLHIDGRYHPNQLDLSEWEHLRELDLSTDVEEDAVSILIGEDVPAAHAVLESHYGDQPNSQPYAVRTPIAWCVAGPTYGESKSQVDDVNLVVTDKKFDDSTLIGYYALGADKNNRAAMIEEHLRGRQLDQREDNLENAVKVLWECEKHGFANKDLKVMSFEDRKALNLLNTGTKYLDGHYEIGLLWRNDPPALVDNRIVAEKRLEYLKRRFRRAPVFAEMYCKAMDVYFEKGYARVMQPEEAALSSPKTWYLPHHGVENVNKPGKVCVVFDAAASFRGTSLNQELLQGPDQCNSLIGVLLKFR
jgi:hypothetical protein